MINKEEFHRDLIQSILADAESRGLMKAQCFFETVCEELVVLGELTNNYTVSEYKKKGLEVYGYDYDEERNILTIISQEFFQENVIQTLINNLIETKFKRLKKFFEKAINELYEDLEPTDPAYSMAYLIWKNYEEGRIDKVRFMIVTDGKTTRNLKEIPSEKFNNIDFEHSIIDIDLLYSIYKSESQNIDSEIETDLNFLKINDEDDSYQSYLSVLPGELIYDIYDKYGKKILEQNVRTFLQFRGNVNKGLRNTIEFKPEMFFAYNNGITATATSLEIENNKITKIYNFQVVNGGQTTSSIYSAKKKNKIDLSMINVQMKLSVVNPECNIDDFVSKVAEYANTQNKVNPSDFFSNSPFHKDMKDHSKRVWAPAVWGMQQRSRWYYERVRGEYLNEQAYLSASEKTKFQLENPKSQYFEKTFISKSENSWEQKPNIVAKGAQFSFKHFSEEITNKLEKNNYAITEDYFKDVICRIILFRNVEKMISNAPWYDGGYRAQTVTYSIAYLSYKLSQSNKYFNFNNIWKNQKLPDNLIDVLEEITMVVYRSITAPSEGSANVASWAKKIQCWERIKTIPMHLDLEDNLLLDREESRYVTREAVKEVKILKGIEMQIFVIQQKEGFWIRIFNYFNDHYADSNISNMQMDILRKYANGNLGRDNYPSEKQSKILYNLYIQAKNEGLSFA